MSETGKSQDDRIVLTLEDVQKWAQEKDDLEPLYYALDLPDFAVYIERDHNLNWTWGIGTKGEFLHEWTSGYSLSRAEMANDVLQKLSELKTKLDLINTEVERETRWHEFISFITRKEDD